MQKLGMINVLFVCLGNICRSPLASGIFNEKVKQLGLENNFKADSCGTSDYHIGELADDRTIQCALNHHIPLVHRARQLQRQDFKIFDYILVMDNKNLQSVTEMMKKQKANPKNVFLLRSFQPAPDSLEVPDPYYGDESDFENVFHILEKSIDGFLSNLLAKTHS
jgi:protein-tyrosine phosphatase